MASGEELRKQLVQKSYLARRANDTHVDITGRINTILDLRKNEGVLTNLAELHDGVVQPLDSSLLPAQNYQSMPSHLGPRDVNLPLDFFIKQDTMLLHLLVELVLQSAHFALDDLLNLIGQLGLNVFLQTAKQKRSQHFV